MMPDARAAVIALLPPARAAGRHPHRHKFICRTAQMSIAGNRRRGRQPGRCGRNPAPDCELARPPTCKPVTARRLPAHSSRRPIKGIDFCAAWKKFLSPRPRPAPGRRNPPGVAPGRVPAPAVCAARHRRRRAKSRVPGCRRTRAANRPAIAPAAPADKIATADHMYTCVCPDTDVHARSLSSRSSVIRPAAEFAGWRFKDGMEEHWLRFSITPVRP